MLPRRLSASTTFRRCRPSDSRWPSPTAWKQLSDAVGGNLIAVNSPLSDPAGAAAALLSKNLRNPYYIGDQPGLPPPSLLDLGNKLSELLDLKLRLQSELRDKVTECEELLKSISQVAALAHPPFISSASPSMFPEAKSSERVRITEDRTSIPLEVQVDSVHFTLTGPSVVPPDFLFEIQFWVHQERQKAEVIEYAKQGERAGGWGLAVKNGRTLPHPAGHQT
jgi:hypothetical protein